MSQFVNDSLAVNGNGTNWVHIMQGQNSVLTQESIRKITTFLFSAEVKQALKIGQGSLCHKR